MIGRLLMGAGDTSGGCCGCSAYPTCPSTCDLSAVDMLYFDGMVDRISTTPIPIGATVAVPRVLFSGPILLTTVVFESALVAYPPAPTPFFLGGFGDIANFSPFGGVRLTHFKVVVRCSSQWVLEVVSQNVTGTIQSFTQSDIEEFGYNYTCDPFLHGGTISPCIGCESNINSRLMESGVLYQ